MSVDVEIEDNTPEFKNDMAKALVRALETIGLRAERNAKIHITRVVYDTPESKSGYKRTGLLRNSITHALSGGEAAIKEYKDDSGNQHGVYEGQMPEESGGGISVYIGTNVEYGPYVELGTSKMAARPFLKPAVTEHVEEYKKILKDELSGS